MPLCIYELYNDMHCLDTLHDTEVDSSHVRTGTEGDDVYYYTAGTTEAPLFNCAKALAKTAPCYNEVSWAPTDRARLSFFPQAEAPATVYGIEVSVRLLARAPC